MVLKITLVFENYATFLFKCALQKEKKQTKSKLYICRQLSMKSSLFWKTYSDKTKFNIEFQTRSSDLTSQNVSFSMAPFFCLWKREL